MRKLKAFVCIMVVTIIAACCFCIIACGNAEQPPTEIDCAIAWAVDEHADVKANGFDALPDKLTKGAEITFTVTVDEGWEIVSVTPTDKISQQSDGSYKLTVSGDTKVRVQTKQKEQAVKYSIEWSIGSHVTVNAVGYDSLPTELEEGTLVKFEVTPDNGYIATVTSASLTEYEDGTYGFELTGDIAVVIVAEIKIEMRVTAPSDMIFYAGDTFVAPNGFKVEIKNSASWYIEVMPELYEIKYQSGGSAFALGDTYFTVKCGNGEERVEIAPVSGRLVLRLDDGMYDYYALDAFDELGEYDYDIENCVLSYIFTQPFKNEFTIPAPTKKFNTGEYEFIGWEGLDGNVIAAGNDKSFVLTAQYNRNLYKITEVFFNMDALRITETIDDYTHAVHITPFTVSVELFAAQSAYIKLIDKTTGKEFDGDVVNKRINVGKYNLSFDYRDLHDEFGDETGSRLFYVEICVTDEAGNEFGERIDTADYDIENLITVYSAEPYRMRNYAYLHRCGYEGMFVQNNPSTALCVYVERGISNNYSMLEAQIVVGEKNGVEVPYLEISGMYYKSYVRSEALDMLNNFIKDICVFNDWDNIASFTQSATLNEYWYYTVSIDISAIEYDKIYVMHSTLQQFDNYPESNNVTLTSSHLNEKVVCNGAEYMLVNHDTGWGWEWLSVQVSDPNVSFCLSDIDLEQSDGKLYYTITYDCKGYTAQELHTLTENVFFDLQGNPHMNGILTGHGSDVWSGDWTRYKGFAVSKEYDETLGKYYIKIDISSASVNDDGEESRILPNKPYCYTTHFGFKEILTENDGVQAPDFKPETDSFQKRFVKFGNEFYQLVYMKNGGNDEYYGCVGLNVFDENQSGMTIDPVGLETNGENAYLVITGSYIGYADAEALKSVVNVNCQNPDNDWETTIFTAAQISVVLNAESGTYTVKVDISELPVGQYLFHFPDDTTDIGNENGIEALSFGNKTVSYEYRDFGNWTRYVLTIV